MFDPKDLAFPIRTASTVSDLRAPAFQIISRIQDVAPDAQVRALALAFVVVSEAVGIPVFDLVHQAQRTMADAEGDYHVHVQAIREYAANELVRRPLA